MVLGAETMRHRFTAAMQHITNLILSRRLPKAFKAPLSSFPSWFATMQQGDTENERRVP
jgi:hypothetical protein